MTFQTFWIMPQQGDVVPDIGSGLRRVEAEVGRKWVRIRAQFACHCVKVPIRKWNLIPHTLWVSGEQLADILPRLNAYQPE